jgi:hypothetical protein
MAGDRDRFNKVLAVAINPGAYEQEAIGCTPQGHRFCQNRPIVSSSASPTPDICYEGGASRRIIAPK